MPVSPPDPASVASLAAISNPAADAPNKRSSMPPARMPSPSPSPSPPPPSSPSPAPAATNCRRHPATFNPHRHHHQMPPPPHTDPPPAASPPDPAAAARIWAVFAVPHAVAVPHAAPHRDGRGRQRRG
ncbi:protein TRACHEARY ELEMENT DIFFERENTIATION-RELATED 7A-like [Oryza sativa Japonica Group]|uniref:protein TRACHEARY ELEMENT DIFFERENTIATION-RELATED 7A-like n=1 Tax=Oryza sativa subsp. japonica TaxID=39947 RepID=UPI00339BD9F1